MTSGDQPLGGAALAGRYWEHTVRPVVDRAFPGLRRAAARLGSGSDVLGLDDVTSRDHDWGLRLTLLVDDAHAGVVDDIDRELERRLPERFAGHPVRFEVSWDRRERHRVEVSTVRSFAASRLGVPLAPDGGLDVTNWLSVPGQALFEVVAGPVFEDTGTELAAVRRALGWYPPDVDRYVLAAWWTRLEQRLPLVGRTASRGDELGSRVLSAGLAHGLMRHAFAVCRVWAPYDKWLGTRFSDLPLGPALRGPLDRAVGGAGWQVRETGLAEAAQVLLDAQRERGLPGPDVAIRPFWDRAFAGVDLAVAADLLAGITDPVVAALPAAVGSIEQWVDAVDVLARPDRRPAVTAAYLQWLRVPGS